MSLTLAVLDAGTRCGRGRDAARNFAYTCHGCHGIENYKNAFPVYSVPKLGGQHAAYMIAALKGYKAQERAHATMHAQSTTLTEQDMQDVAASLAGTELKPTGRADQRRAEGRSDMHRLSWQ